MWLVQIIKLFWALKHHLYKEDIVPYRATVRIKWENQYQGLCRILHVMCSAQSNSSINISCITVTILCQVLIPSSLPLLCRLTQEW